MYINHSCGCIESSVYFRSCTPSPKPSGGARHLRALSAAEAYAELLQEKSLSNFKNNQLHFLSEQQETQTVLKEKEQADLQVNIYTHKLICIIKAYLIIFI